MERVGRVGSALLAILLASAALARTGAPTAAAVIEVPGGIAAVARLLGHVDSDPERFVSSLNQLLLSTTDGDHAWQSVPQRRDLVRYLDLVRELERRFPAGTMLGPAGDERRAVERLASTLGFELIEDARRGSVMLPRGDGDGDPAFRRAVAQALGLELARAGDRVDAGESWALTIPRDRVVSPLPAPLWEQVTGRPLDADALTVLAQDQRLGLLIEGRGALSSSTRAALDGMDLRWLYQSAPFAFRRYAAAFSIENGRLIAPGGDAALPLWRATVGASDASPEALLRALLESHRAKGAYLWQSLRFAPPAMVAYFIGGATAGGGLLRSVFDRLDESTGGFDSSLATQPGFAALARSLPIDGDPPRLDLPGGPGLWLDAIAGDLSSASLDPGGSGRLGEDRGLSEAALLLELLAEQTGRPGPNTSLVPRFVRAANLFSQHPAIYSPETVVLAARGSDLYAPALDLFDVLELRSPQSARDYLSTVASLDRLSLDWPREQLVMAFQGGSAWLRAMAAAGRVDGATLEQALSSWSAIHRGHADPGVVAAGELAWIVELLRRLPPAPEDAPGRGPLERAMVQALIAEVEPEISWMGLDYAADRSLLAAAMVENLEFFAIPGADRLAELDDSLDDLARRCRDEDLEAAKVAAARLRGAVAGLPSPIVEDALAGGDVERRFANPDRRELLSLAEDVLGRARAKGLAGVAPRVERSSRQLAADLRPFLVAPAYLVALAAGRGPLLQDRSLVRRHRLVLENPAIERAWSEASVERGDDDHPGTWITGHVGTVDSAMASFLLSTASLRTGRGVDQRRASTWCHHLSATRWHQLDPALTAAVAATMDLGWAVVGIARSRAGSSTGAHELELVTSIVPRGRLESSARTPPGTPVSPAEALMVGLAVLDRSGGGSGIAGAGDHLAAAGAAVGALGADWRERLHRAGLATPVLNGKASPWLAWWPSYEAVEHDGRSQALIERELVDLHLSVVAYLGRHALPGFVGSDLMRHTIEELAASVELSHERDWQSVLRTLGRMDDAYFEARFRQCLRDGLYRLQDL